MAAAYQVQVRDGRVEKEPVAPELLEFPVLEARPTWAGWRLTPGS